MESVLSKLILLLLFCIQTLTADAAAATSNTRQLANAALTVSATRASEASAYVSSLSSGKSPREQSELPSALQDCTTMMSHSADRLHRSVEEMSRLGRAGSPDYALHLSNVQTWVSSALTDQDMCLDSLSRAGGAGFSSTRSTEGVRKKVVSARQVTSRALSLVNRMSN